MNTFLSIPTMGDEQLPIVYSPRYNFRAFGLERLHPFDGRKFERIVDLLGVRGLTVEPVALPWNFLKATHTAAYLDSLHGPNAAAAVAAILEIGLIRWLPRCIVRRFIVERMRLHYSGTVQAAWLALEHGWAVNVGGGFHHASRGAGHGFCMFNDLSAAAWSLLEGRHVGECRGPATRAKRVERVMIVDLDAHQGDGHEEDLEAEIAAGRVHIVDAYDPTLFPQRADLRPWIGTEIHYDEEDTGAHFLRRLRKKLPRALDVFQPDIVLYNAGTDTLEGDPVSGLQQTAETILERDRLVWQACRSRGIPIAMTLSGGYQRRTAEVVAESLKGVLGL